MKDNYLPNWNMPDFSPLTDIACKMQEINRPIIQSFQSVQEIIRPITESLEKLRVQITSAFAGMVEFSRLFTAIQIMGETQFVCWDVLDKQFVKELIESSNPNKTLRAFVSKNKFAYVNNTIPISRIKNIPLDTLNIPIATYIKSCPFSLIPKPVGTIEWG